MLLDARNGDNATSRTDSRAPAVIGCTMPSMLVDAVSHMKYLYIPHLRVNTSLSIRWVQWVARPLIVNRDAYFTCEFRCCSMCKSSSRAHLVALSLSHLVALLSFRGLCTLALSVLQCKYAESQAIDVVA